MSLFKVDNFTESLKVFKKDFPFNSCGGRGKGWRIWEYFPYCSLQISFVTDKERFFNNQELLEWVVTSFILVTLMFDSVVITYIEIRC